MEEKKEQSTGNTKQGVQDISEQATSNVCLIYLL